MRGRKPTPTALKLVNGNPGKRALPQNEAQPVAVEPPIPAALTKAARAEWKRLIVPMVDVGLITEVDGPAFAAFCASYALWAKASDELEACAAEGMSGGLLVVNGNGNLTKNPLVGIMNDAAADMVRYASEFGMTPAARARIGTKGKAPDPAGDKPKGEGAGKFFG